MCYRVLRKKIEAIANPYPEDVFPSLSKQQCEDLKRLLQAHGYLFDTIAGSICRLAFEVCRANVLALLETELKGEKGTQRIKD